MKWRQAWKVCYDGIHMCRLRKPISDEEALAIGKTFDVPALFEHVARARRRVVGAMFPTDIV